MADLVLTNRERFGMSYAVARNPLGYSVNAFRVLMAILPDMLWQEDPKAEFTFTVADLNKKLTDFGGNRIQARELKPLLSSLTDTLEFEDTCINAFQLCRLSSDKKHITVRLSDLGVELFQDLSKGNFFIQHAYPAFQFKRKHSWQLYLLLASYKNIKGTYTPYLSHLRYVLGVSSTQSDAMFIRRILTPALEEIKEYCFPDLKIGSSKDKLRVSIKIGKFTPSLKQLKGF